MRKTTAERDRTTGQPAECGDAQAGPTQSEQTSPSLDACYGQIGISAVAAAARYQGTAKNPAYAPTSNDWRWRLRYAEELA